MRDRRHHFYIPLAVAVVTTTVVVIGLVEYWFGTPRGDTMWFCERVRPGFVKQPANTWSNFGFIIAGVYIGWLSYRNRFTAENLMTATFFFPVLFACIVVFLGPGSIAMHGSNGPWGGFLDLLSMFMISSFVFCYALNRLFRLPDTVFVALFLVSVVASSWINLQPFNGASPYLTISEYIFALQLVLSFPAELYIRFAGRTGSAVVRGMASVLTMCTAFLIWNLSRTTESWFCDPDSLIQGHAIWHILNALAAYFLFMYYVTEEMPVLLADRAASR
jgi:hypothetical protein